MNLKFNSNHDDRAVSPVIGVILMVAITVILAAVIGAFVLDLGSGQQENANAGVSIEESGSEVTFQLTDAGNADGVYIKANTTSDYMQSDGTRTSSETYALENVGDSATTEIGSNYNAPVEFSVIAEKGDQQNVIRTYTVSS
ncbi:type IV pilin N-terminal domain-containing protein [Halostella litorea]|uniref:type IV pilin N-terminal domain-containing protein n=1 Tax=Halostella litorea TaxID=2528831 RepID=UPI0028738869|nr:type IV pilin N-terminal domain-containing protein [Halostella litorea]